ncbi:recombinase family protein [Micromonospora sp. CPCC 206171]|uniref:recombinase family protein n=1 Tax=Micromonospora sp. CPCC 206171 TaxID=3122405 RepID=UPI002FEEB398
MRVLGVIRLSRETDESTSPERQRDDIKKWCDLHRHTLIGFAEDLDVSGAVDPFERPQLGTWLREQADEFDVIVGAKVDRLSRKLLHFVQLIDWANRHGKVVASASEPINTGDKWGRALANLLAMFAEMERDWIQERNQGSQQLAREEGRWHGGTPPYGYLPQKHSSGKGYVLAVDPESSERVREMVRRILKGESMNAICQDFNARGIPTPSDHYRSQVGKPSQGHRWKTTALIPILRSKTILGIAEKNGQVILDAEDRPVKRAEAIVSREDWDNLQVRLDQNSRLKTRSATSSFLLNLLYCAECGEPCYRLITGAATAKVRHVYYRCRGKAEKRNDCTATSVRADALEGTVESMFLAAAGEFEVMKRVVLPAESHVEELRQAQESLDYLLNEIEDKPAAVRQVYQPRIDRLQERIIRLASMPERPQTVEMRGTGQTFRQVWDQADISERREILKAAGLRVFTIPPVASGSTDAVDSYWAELSGWNQIPADEIEESRGGKTQTWSGVLPENHSMTQGKRVQMRLDPHETGGPYIWLVWHGDLAEKIRAKMQ